MRLLVFIFLLSPLVQAGSEVPKLAARGDMPAALQHNPELDGRGVIELAYQAAGKDFLKPDTLFLTGYNIIRSGGKEVLWDQYAMWREFSADKGDAHVASGKVRIEAWTDDQLAMLVSFDGDTTYNQDGPVADQSANVMWASNFGFGAIRHALDDGWQQQRKVDRLIDGEPTYMVQLTDPVGGSTLFGIRQRDNAIVYVGFDTPRGWHERRYSHFFEKEGIDWRQAGRVRLYYNGEKANEAIWTDFWVNRTLDDVMFKVTSPPKSPSWH